MPARFHTDPHARSLRPKIAIKLFRFLGMLQPPFLNLPCFGIYKRYLLKARVIICSYNDHCSAPFSEPLWLVGPTKVYSDLGADIVMESISPTTKQQVDRRDRLSLALIHSSRLWLRELPLPARTTGGSRVHATFVTIAFPRNS